VSGPRPPRGGEERAEGTPPALPPFALVAAADAALRIRVFDRLAARGYRVDAVGDATAVARRLAKDRYDLVVTDTLEIPELPGTRVLRVDPAVAREELERLLA
jgi:hypothetical protein